MRATCTHKKAYSKNTDGLFSDDLVEKADFILRESQFGLGAYSESKGLAFVRKAIAEFIIERDSFEGVEQTADPENIYLTDGASKGVQAALSLLITSKRDGVLIPIPQYPLYSATLTLYGGCLDRLDYLNEDSGWSLNEEILEESLQEATRQAIRPRAIVVINPSNPTGKVLDEATIRMVINFAKKHELVILADEVYQENIYKPGIRFVSFAHTMTAMAEREVSLFSFHSISKGFLGECGHRGGYMEIRNVPTNVLDQITKLQSISLCSNLPGQVITYLMVSPPKPGDQSFETYRRERNTILSDLTIRAKIMEEGLNSIPGYHCQPIEGAMYAFPSLSLPRGMTDEEYCMELLEKTGICVVAGSGFGQRPGTAHF